MQFAMVYQQNNREAVLWMAAHHTDKKVLEFLSKEIAPAGTGMGKRHRKLGYQTSDA